MHLVIPHASALGEACAHTLGDLALPRLSRLLGRLWRQNQLGSDEFSLLTPFEQVLVSLGGAAREDWTLMTPIHMAIGSDQATAVPLELDVSESQAFFASLAELWPAAEGWRAQWRAPAQWLVAHDSFAGLESASADRVLGRGVEPWLTQARPLRRFQNEVQMLLHGSPLNEAREARGALPLNSVWLSAWLGEPPAGLRIDARLREPLLAGDWAAWAEAWRALDATLPEQLPDAEFKLTLCGERFAHTFTPAPRSAFTKVWQSLVPPQANVAKILEAL